MESTGYDRSAMLVHEDTGRVVTVPREMKYIK
jgi:hypothetical protein